MAVHWLLCVVAMALLSVATPLAAANKLNFVIMLMDDMGWGDLGVYGHPAQETPNLDRMAREGMMFTDFYSGSEICSPCYSPQDVLGGIADSEVLFSEKLKEHGYKNKIVGKWHLGHRPQYLPLKHGFDEWFGAPNCHYKYNDFTMPNIPVYKNEDMIGRYYDDIPINHTTGIGNLTQWYIQEALEWIERQHAAGEAFLLYWAPDATHTPVYASEKFRGRSIRGLYGDAVMELDYGVGRILDKLQELGIQDNTFAFFSSDNGAATYAHEEGGSNGPFLCGKQTTYEGGMRQPALAWWPGHIHPNQVSRQVGNLMDIFPTVLDMADIPLPKDVFLDGHSIKGTLLNHTEPYDRPVFMYRGDTLFKVRYGHYKAHLYTWGTPLDAQKLGYHYCPGERIVNLTQDEMLDFTTQPLLFHLGRDPGEKYAINPDTEEYRAAMLEIGREVIEHHKHMVPAKPEFNMCDLAVQNWAPVGCEKINRCMKAPPSYPYRCQWPY